MAAAAACASMCVSVGASMCISVVTYCFARCPQKKEPVGDDDTLPESVTSQLAQLTADQLRPLTVTQLKVSTVDRDPAQGQYRRP